MKRWNKEESEWLEGRKLKVIVVFGIINGARPSGLLSEKDCVGRRQKWRLEESLG